jgi:hypothetical protein
LPLAPGVQWRWHEAHPGDFVRAPRIGASTASGFTQVIPSAAGYRG